MKIEDIVCSLELSIKLKELDVKQESLFYWYKNPYQGWIVINHNELNEIFSPGCSVITSAFTSDELLKILPNFIRTNEYDEYRFSLTRYMLCPSDDLRCFESHFIINYLSTTYEVKLNGKEGYEFPTLADKYMKNIHHKKLSDALAKVLIYLIENKLYEINNEDKGL